VLLQKQESVSPAEIELAASAVRIPVHGSGLTGGVKLLAPAVDAPYGYLSSLPIELFYY